MRGLIHFHTRFSDGWATVRQAAEIAKRNGFDFLIVTDHLRNLKLKTHRTLEEYVAACDRASARTGIPVIPGGEIEIHWERTGVDRSEAHTIVYSIRPLLQAKVFDWTTPGKDPFWYWEDEEGKRGTIAAVQRTLSRLGLPRAASHQFQHSFLGIAPGEHPDFRVRSRANFRERLPRLLLLGRRRRDARARRHKTHLTYVRVLLRLIVEVGDKLPARINREELIVVSVLDTIGVPVLALAQGESVEAKFFRPALRKRVLKEAPMYIEVLKDLLKRVRFVEGIE